MTERLRKAELALGVAERDMAYAALEVVTSGDGDLLATVKLEILVRCTGTLKAAMLEHFAARQEAYPLPVRHRPS